ncbi:MAG: PhzF family phenazine biosynthesis protein [Acidobacteriota bacterium]|nr:PhzF family phenazine biosynthesis protein [Acidobacteriota bacterium]
MRYLHYDVFTDRLFEGNQLAVFPDGRGLSAAQMQTITREMNFSESTFVVPAETADTDVRMRIFTPGAELPMAGHPTIGTTFALAHEGVIEADRARWVFGLGVGPTPVELIWTHGRLSFAWMDQRPPVGREPVSSRADIIRAAGVEPGAVDATRLPIEEISCGTPFIFVPVQTRAAVDAAQPDMSAMRQLQSAFPGGHIAVFIFSTEAVDPAIAAYSRMFAPSMGIPEDPATGGASGPLGSYLVKHGLVTREQQQDMVSLQGVAMGRPSRIHMRITEDSSGQIARVQVGGQAVRVGAGTIDLE